MTYYYVVTAIDGTGNESAYSDEVSATIVSGGSTVLSVSDVGVCLQQTGRHWRATGTISVVDDVGGRVANATVTVDWTLELASGGVVGLGTKQGQTDDKGVVSLTSAKHRASAGDLFKATVVEVSKVGTVYDPGPSAPTGSAVVP